MTCLNDYELWFACVQISARSKIKLIKKYNSVENIWIEFIRDRKNNVLNNQLIKKLSDAWQRQKIDELKRRINESKMGVTTYFDKDYPQKLKNIEDPPYLLFYYGDMKPLNDTKTVSIVGARKCSYYGVDAARVISGHLAESGVTLISGMARGIDSIAHNACIKIGKYTCAVLGSGLDVIYPKENRSLFNEICKQGCVITEFLPGTQPLAYNFPIRNRIVSGLSDLIVVIEAGERSGSLITADAALEQGKDVIAIPGSIFSDTSKGANKLIRDGAYIYTSIEDIYNLLNIKHKDSVKIKEKSEQVSEFEKNISSLICDTPRHIDDIIRITNIDIQPLYEVLFEMQLRNKVRCISGCYYVKVNDSVKI